jgi:hypothetical protein
MRCERRTPFYDSGEIHDRLGHLDVAKPLMWCPSSPADSPWVTHSETRMGGYFQGFGLINALCGYQSGSSCLVISFSPSWFRSAQKRPDFQLRCALNSKRSTWSYSRLTADSVRARKRRGRADYRFCGPCLFGLVMKRSNSCARIGGHSHAVRDQTAAFVLLVGAHARVFVVT